MSRISVTAQAEALCHTEGRRGRPDRSLGALGEGVASAVLYSQGNGRGGEGLGQGHWEEQLEKTVFKV